MKFAGSTVRAMLVTLILLSQLLFVACYKSKPPGTLPDVDSIPTADESTVGKEVAVNIKQDYAFTFYKDKGNGQERLVVIKHNPEETLKTFVVPLTVYETAFGGIDALVEQIDSAFTGRIIAERTISFTEAMHMTASVYGLAKKLIDGARASQNREATIDVCYGIVTNESHNDQFEKALIPLADDHYLILVGNHQYVTIRALEECANVFDVTYKRFDLKQYLPIN